MQAILPTTRTTLRENPAIIDEEDEENALEEVIRAKKTRTLSGSERDNPTNMYESSIMDDEQEQLQEMKIDDDDVEEDEQEQVQQHEHVEGSNLREKTQKKKLFQYLEPRIQRRQANQRLSTGDYDHNGILVVDSTSEEDEEDEAY
jgi:hypothetical protein